MEFNTNNSTDSANNSNNFKKIQTSSNSIAYQKLSTENYKFKKKLKTEKCVMKKKLLIISIIIIAIIFILFIVSLLYYSSIKTKKKTNIVPKQNFAKDYIANNVISYSFIGL